MSDIRGCALTGCRNAAWATSRYRLTDTYCQVHKDYRPDPFGGIPNADDSDYAGTELATERERLARVARNAEHRRLALETRPAPGSVRDLIARTPAWW